MSQVDFNAMKNEARRRIHNLVEDYMRVLANGKKEAFNEERVKIAFIVPTLEALGWNSRTDEVLPEQATLTGRADFGLRVGGRTKIFVEMKSFKKSLDGYDTVKGRHRSYAEQAIQYAWGMKADWAVLTNFEEIRLYDSHVKKPEDGLVWKKPIRFTEYESRFDELWLISKESVVSGALDAYRAKVERPPVDEAFLIDLMNCRQLLAEDIKKNNPSLIYDLINESVQKILDRLIFIKNCEDRLIIPAETLWKRLKAWQETAIDRKIVTFMMDLKNTFRYFDQVYNGKLFEKHPCEDLKISNEVLEEIIDTLYGDGQHLGYNFSVIPVDVLGQAYELYIGSIIKEKEGLEQAIKIVKELGKRKKYGIYYTPEYIVDYIVRNTLGKLLKNCNTPEDVSRIKVLDPACGSGSFLIKAFDVIKEWYDNYNRKQPVSNRNTLDAHIVAVPNIEERILTENLYGVDLDAQAVEITMLNLSLKAVKTREKLPYMGDHIKCGNSLISGSKEEMMEHFGDLWKEKKAFEWREAFPEVFKQGGFDVVIGNPPYYSMETRTREEQNFFKNVRPDLYRGKNDVYYYFIAFGLDYLRDGGQLGFIVERYWLEATYADKLRAAILGSAIVKEIIDFGKMQIFPESGNHTCILITGKETVSEKRRDNFINVVKVKNWNKSNQELISYIQTHLGKKEYKDDFIQVFGLKQATLSSEQWILATQRSYILLDKLLQDSWKLIDLCEIEQGQKSGLNKVFTVTEREIQTYNLEKTLLRKMIKNSDINRYSINWEGRYLIYTTAETDIEDYPNTKKYLEKFREALSNRAEAKDNLYSWYRLQRPRKQKLFDAPQKLAVPYRAPENRFGYDNHQYFNDGGDIRVIIPKQECPVDIKYILGCLNSMLLNFYYKFIGRPKGEVLEYFVEPLSKLPIHKIDFNDVREKTIYGESIQHVDKMLHLNHKLNQLDENFERYLTAPILDYINFKRYYDELSVNEKRISDKVARGYVKTINIEELGNWLIFKVDYSVQSRGRKQEFNNVEVLRCRFEDKLLRKFLFYIIKNYKKPLGTGNLLYKILTLKIPCFDKNSEKNKQIIDEITKMYLEAIKERKRLKEEIQESDNLIDKKVYELYKITPEEISLIENSLA